VRTVIRPAVVWCAPGVLHEDGRVVVEGGRVAYVGPPADAPEAEASEGGDWFLMAGGVDRHVHVGLSDPGAILLGGVVAVRDLGWPPDHIFPLADASDGPAFNGPRIIAAGPMLTAISGYPTRAGWAPEGTGLEVADADGAAAAVRALADRGAGAIKVALNADAGPTLGDRELVAICQAARGRGLRVTAHVQGRGQAERALGAGVDELAHCPWEPLSDAVIAGLARSVRIVSTLDMHSHGRDTPALRAAASNLRRFREAGGAVVYGTDLGNGPIPPGLHAGEALHLRAAGMAPEEVLQAMTAGPLAPGAPADLVGLAGDPREDLAALGRVRFVMRSGRVIRRT